MRLLLAASLSVIAFAPLSGQTGAERPCIADAKPANLDFVLKDGAGKDVKLASALGKVIVLNFWATWCMPCRAEMVDLVALQTKYGTAGLQIFGVSVDDTPDKLLAAAVTFKTNYPLLVGLNRDDLQDAYGPIWGVPRTFVIGRTGKICRRYSGIVPREKFESAIIGLLKDKAPAGVRR